MRKSKLLQLTTQDHSTASVQQEMSSLLKQKRCHAAAKVVWRMVEKNAETKPMLHHGEQLI